MKIEVLLIKMMNILQYKLLMNQAQVILLVVMNNGNVYLQMNVFRYVYFVTVQ